LESYPEVFDDMYLALVSAGEEAGLLPDVLERESNFLRV
jgi:type IV pilus assembly protein PilC